MTQAIFIAAWFVAIIALFFSTSAFMPWWIAKLRGDETPDDALGKFWFGLAIFAVAAALAFAAGVIGHFTGGWS